MLFAHFFMLSSKTPVFREKLTSTSYSRTPVKLLSSPLVCGMPNKNLNGYCFF